MHPQNPLLTELETRAAMLDDPTVTASWLTDGTLYDLLGSSQVLLAESASDLETGLRRRDEKLAYDDALDVYRTILSRIAIGQTVALLADETKDVDVAKRHLRQLLVSSKLEVVSSDITRRLEISHLERMKMRVTHNRVTRMAGNVALAGALGGGTYAMGVAAADGAAPTSIRLGSFFVGVGVMAKPAVTMGFRKVGEIAKQKVNGSMDFYNSAELREIIAAQARKKGKQLNDEEYHDTLTRYHMRESTGKIADLILTSDLSDRSEATVTRLVAEAMDALEESLDDFYRVEDKQPNKLTMLARKILRRKAKPSDSTVAAANL